MNSRGNGKRVSDRHAAVFQPQIVRDHRNEFGVGRLAARILHGVAEERVQHLQIAAVPRDLDGVTNRTLDTRGGGRVHLGNGGIQHLGDGIDDLNVVDGHNDRRPQVGVPLDVRGYADLVNDLRHLRFQIVQLLLRLDDGTAALFIADALDSLGKQRVIQRLNHTIGGARVAAFLEKILVGEAGQHNEAGLLVHKLLM